MTTLEKILVVDDSPLMRKGMTRILNGMCEVLPAANGSEAWDVLQANRDIRLVCCDLNMPVIDGYEFIGKVRASNNPYISEMPVIIVTGQTSTEEEQARIFELGATDFLQKPLKAVEMKARVGAHMKLVEAANTLKQELAKLEAQATIDPVTGLGARVFFIRSAAQICAYATHHSTPVYLLLVSIDNFQEYFQKQGFQAGSELMREVGKIYAEHSLPEHVVSRIGVGVFSSMVLNIPGPLVLELAERVRKDVQQLTGHTVTCLVHELENEETLDIAKLLTNYGIRLSELSHDNANHVISIPEIRQEKPVNSDTSQPAQIVSLDEVSRQCDLGDFDVPNDYVLQAMKKIVPILMEYAKDKDPEIKKAVYKIKAGL